jgi:hypothetical protein
MNSPVVRKALLGVKNIKIRDRGQPKAQKFKRKIGNNSSSSHVPSVKFSNEKE